MSSVPLNIFHFVMASLGGAGVVAAASSLQQQQQQISGAPTGGVAASPIIEASDGVSGNKLLIRIQNLSATTDLGVKLDLKKIALKCRNTEYNPRRYGAVIMRLRDPMGAQGLIFGTGKVCVTGIKSTPDAEKAIKQVAYLIEKIGFKPQEFYDCKIQNIVGIATCGFSIRLEALVYAHSAFASYEPELFPGLIYRLVAPTRVVCLIFVSGKVVITGAKKESDLSNALTKIYPVLLEFKKVSLPADKRIANDTMEE